MIRWQPPQAPGQARQKTPVAQPASEFQRSGEALKNGGQILNCRDRREVVGRLCVVAGVLVGEYFIAGVCEILPAGIYFVSVQTGDSIVEGRVIKTNE